MNRQEAVVLCRYVLAVCPQQAIDDYTPDAWADLLVRIPLVDARDAVRALGARQAFIAPSEIIAETKRIRARRINEADHPVPPPDLSPAEAAAWLRAAWRSIGDGRPVADDTRGQVVARQLQPILQAVAAPHDMASS